MTSTLLVRRRPTALMLVASVAACRPTSSPVGTLEAALEHLRSVDRLE